MNKKQFEKIIKNTPYFLNENDEIDYDAIMSILVNYGNRFDRSYVDKLMMNEINVMYIDIDSERG